SSSAARAAGVSSLPGARKGGTGRRTTRSERRASGFRRAAASPRSSCSARPRRASIRSWRGGLRGERVAGLRAGRWEAGTGAATSDLIVYSRSKGVYAGVDVSGSGVKPSEDYNEAYYGKPASPIDIIVRGSVHNPQANAALMSKVAKLWGK